MDEDGHVAAKHFVYRCPFCEGTVDSKLRTGHAIEAHAVAGFVSKMGRWQPKNMFIVAPFVTAPWPAS